MLPALYPFGTEQRWLEVAPAFFAEADFDLLRQQLQRGLIPLVAGPELALDSGISPKLLSHMVVKTRRYYRTFEIEKKSGGKRVITAPRVFLKTVQRYILDCIVSQVPPHEAACAFRRGYNCATGAQRHVHQPYVWNIDLADFFPSIAQAQIVAVFREIGYPDAAARYLSGLCCLDRRLPQGAPTSPALANLVAARLDQELTSEAASHGMRYSRYADDMTFSSTDLISASFRESVIALVERHGFRVRTEKTRLMGPAHAQRGYRLNCQPAGFYPAASAPEASGVFSSD